MQVPVCLFYNLSNGVVFIFLYLFKLLLMHGVTNKVYTFKTRTAPLTIN